MSKDYPLTQEEFTAIYTKVPRLTVEIIVKSDRGVLLTKRAIYPAEGYWHIPGGTVRYNESIRDAVTRVAKDEVGLAINKYEIIGMIEYPSLDKINYGDPRGLAILVTDFSGEVAIDEEASEYGWFTTVPEKILQHQDDFLIEKGILQKITKTD